MRLLPTPYQYQHGEEISPISGFCKVDCRIPQDETISWGLEKLREVFVPCPDGELYDCIGAYDQYRP